MYAAFAAAAAAQPARAALSDGTTAAQLLDAAGCVRAALVDTLPPSPPRRAPDAALVAVPHVVVVAMPRSADYVAALLGVLSAGAAWLAVDVRWPRRRLAALLADAAPGAALVADGAGAAALADALAEAALPQRCALIRCDELTLWRRPAAARPAPPAEVAGAAVAYLCYTSGSSGAPKAVLGTAAGLLARCAWAAAACPAAADDVAALRTPPAFVDAAAELFAPLLAGVPLAVVPEAADADPLALAACLSAARVTRLTMLPSLLDAAVPALAASASAPHLRLLCVSGEALTWRVARAAAAALPAARILNVYGCTEVGADATVCDVSDALARGADAGAASPFVPIGAPLPGVWAAVLDDAGAPVREAGAWGQLLVGGVGVAAGYLNAPALTAAKFPAVPGRGRAHATGDVACWTPRGALALAGRADAQVKVRGARVDLSELQAALAAHPAVAAAVARAWAPAREGGETRLAAYAVLRRDTAAPTGAEQLLTWLRERLPPPAVPAALLLLPALPRTAAGKVDRAALPQPGSWHALADAAAAAAATALEARLCAAFAAAAGAPAARVSADADFFAALGGTSLAAAALCARLALPLPALLAHPTPRALARSGLVPPQAAAGAPPQWLDDADAERADSDQPAAKRLRLPPSPPPAEPLLTDAEDAEPWMPALALSFAGRCDAVGDVSSPPAVAPPSPRDDDAAPLPAAALSCAWRVPLRACVDASPLLLLPAAAGAHRARWRAVVGSHAHAVLCVEFDAPTAASAPRPTRVVWTADVGARVEAAAAALRDGRHCAVGAHDGSLTLLRLSDGAVVFRHVADGALKAAPACDPWRGRVWAASHGREALALAPPPRARLVWRARLGGAVSAPPAFDAIRRRVYFATLGGALHAINDSGEAAGDDASPRQAWCADVGAAVFGAPAVAPRTGAVLLAAADGVLHALAAADGGRLWTLRPGGAGAGPLFAAPTLLGERHALVGTHEGALLCVRAADGAVAWRLLLPGGRVAAAAAVDGAPPRGWPRSASALLAVAATSGDVHIIAAPAPAPDAEEAAASEEAQLPVPRILASARLPGEAFSAPVMRAGALLLGCRDDWLYGLQVALS